MKNFVGIINYAKAQKGAGSKKRIADKLAELDTLGEKLVGECMSPYRVFNVRQYDEPEGYALDDADPQVFLRLLDQLHDREITGNAARTEVTSVLSKYTEETAAVLKLVLNKDFRAGFSGETVNKVLRGNKKPKDPVVDFYDCMLAEKMPKAGDKKQYLWPEETGKDVIIEAKYDGQRNNAWVDHSHTLQTSDIIHRARSGKTSSHLDGLFDEELKRLEEYVGCAIVLDCEAMGSDFQATMNAKSSKNDKAKDDLKLFAYDIVMMGTWLEEGKTPTQLERSQFLEKIINETGCKLIVKSKWKLCKSRDEAIAFHSECIAEGYEGTVLKDIDGVYEWKRSKSWVKFKNFDTYDGQIVGFYAGRKDTRLEDSLGGIYVEGVDENGVKFECSCGSGFSDELRSKIWAKPEEYIDKMVELEADAEISSKDNREVQSLRWPIFKQFRPDKDV